MNQQKFGFMLDGDKVLAKAGKGILPIWISELSNITLRLAPEKSFSEMK